MNSATKKWFRVDGLGFKDTGLEVLGPHRKPRQASSSVFNPKVYSSNHHRCLSNSTEPRTEPLTGLWSTIILYFFLKGTLIMKQKFILFSPWLLKSPATIESIDLQFNGTLKRTFGNLHPKYLGLNN